MGHRLTASEEVQQLRQATREAHEAAQELHQAIREARNLQPTLVAEFEQVHQREMALLSNHVIEEGNRATAELNANIDQAQEMIFNEIMSGKLVVDVRDGRARVKLGGMRFDTSQPVPYPQVTRKEENQ